MKGKFRNHMKKVFAVAAASMLTLGSFAAIACGDGRDSDPKKLTFWFWGSPAEINVYNQLIQQYQDEHPDVTIAPIHFESNVYMDKFVAERNKPDVFFMPDTDFLTWADAGVMLNLNDYVTEEELNLLWPEAVNEYYYNPETKTLGKSEGAHFYGFPKDLGPVCLTYNKTLLEQQIARNNLDRDEVYDLLSADRAMTWTQFRTLLKDLTKDQDKSSPAQIYGIPYYEMDIAMYSNGADYFKNNAETHGIDDRFIEAVAFNIQLATVDKVMPSADMSGGTDAYTKFFNSRTIFTWMGPWDNADFWTQVKFGYDVIPAPRGDHDDTQSVSMIGSMCYGVSAAMAAKNPAKAKTAIDFAKWLSMSETCQKKSMELGQQVPNLLSMAQDFISSTWEVEPAHRSLFVDIIDGNSNSVGIYSSEADDKISGKTRSLYYTYDSTWKDNLMSYIDDRNLWRETSYEKIKSALEAYKNDLQADLNEMNERWKG